MPRPAKRPAPSPHRRSPPARPARPAAPRAPTEAQRRKALDAAWAAATTRLWPVPPATVSQFAGLTVLAGPVPRGRPHWLLLTRGLAATGAELALRVLRQKDEAAPPAWALSLLGTLATRTLAGDLRADPDQCVQLAQGVAPGTGTDLVALACAADPELPAVVTPHDTVPVRLVVPLTADEARVLREWSPAGLLEVLAKVDPLLVTDLERPSLLSSPRARALIEQRVDREGSSLSAMTAAKSQVVRAGDKVTWTLSADAVDAVVSLLKGRTAHRRPFSVVSGASRVHVLSADAPRVEVKAKELTLGVSQVAARQLRAQLRARPGTYSVEVLPNFAVAVV